MDRQTIATSTARLRFAIIGPLLASPPPRGRLQAAIRTLSEQDWITPDGRTRRFSTATIERWYYAAQRAGADPMAALRRRRRSDAGHRRSVSHALLAAVWEQYAISEDGRDDACWREASCGTVSFHDAAGKRLKTLYFGRMPESGKVTPKAQLAAMVAHIQRAHPHISINAVADGAADNWTFLKSLSPETETIDF